MSCPVPGAPVCSRMGQVGVGGMAGVRRLRWKIRLALLTALAVSLAFSSLAVAVLSWLKCRSLSRSLQAWESSLQRQGDVSMSFANVRSDLPQEVGSPAVRLSFLQGLLESKALTRIRRDRRRDSGVKTKQPMAAHFEVMPNNVDGTYIVEKGGIIRQWLECPLETTKSAVTYNNKTARFTVHREGVYYIYSQVHCDDNTTAYLKLDVMVDKELTFRCVQGLPPTPTYSQQLAVHSCQASGLVRLRKKSQISVYSIAGVHLKPKTFTHFGLFKL
ncbi:tumor necrosis factor ligand superfamily member 12 isoform X1 [Chiloscyllium plagiosum]|uniref:tumor necrosis factor ligand superfamily member 12 isoform X1 n=2 Tax=Chiloscyllium plagiosum TaxID=36176 RepID=UPI001CB806FC|nr:tumor necrosis factor ligand superfamily member 12 isoform X1 [Chiloscyllium plagiosum]